MLFAASVVPILDTSILPSRHTCIVWPVRVLKDISVASIRLAPQASTLVVIAFDITFCPRRTLLCLSSGCAFLFPASATPITPTVEIYYFFVYVFLLPLSGLNCRESIPRWRRSSSMFHASAFISVFTSSPKQKHTWLNTRSMPGSRSSCSRGHGQLFILTIGLRINTIPPGQ